MEYMKKKDKKLKYWAKRLKKLELSHQQLANLLEITRNTMYKRFEDGKWKTYHLRILRRLKLIEEKTVIINNNDDNN